MKKNIKLFFALIATALLVCFFLSNHSDLADEDSRSVVLGGECTHRGCSCKQMKTRMTKDGHVSDGCAVCNHWTWEHK